jgi:hypothetical protein
MTTYPVPTRRWTRAEYDRLIEVGVLSTRGWRYASRTVLAADASAMPLAVPSGPIPVGALLP